MKSTGRLSRAFCSTGKNRVKIWKKREFTAFFVKGKRRASRDGTEAEGMKTRVFLYKMRIKKEK